MYAQSPAIIFSINYEQANKYMDSLMQNQKEAEKLAFLLKNVPGMKSLMHSNRDKILGLFTMKSYLPNQVIFNEG